MPNPTTNTETNANNTTTQNNVNIPGTSLQDQTVNQQPPPANNIITEQNPQPPANGQIVSGIQDQQNDNVVFIESLNNPQLREEVLLNCPEDFLINLPPAIQAEARRIRERVTLPRINFNEDVMELENFFNSQINSINRKEKLLTVDNTLLNIVTEFKKNRCTNKFIEINLRQIYNGKFLNNFPYTLCSSLIFNLENEYKFFDAMLFILEHPNLNVLINESIKKLNLSKEKDSSIMFPPISIRTNGSEIEDYKKVYEIISGKILTIMLKLTESHIYSFLKDYSNAIDQKNQKDPESKSNKESTSSKKSFSSLPSISNLKVRIGSINNDNSENDQLIYENKNETKSIPSSNLFTSLIRLASLPEIYSNGTKIDMLLRIILNIVKQSIRLEVSQKTEKQKKMNDEYKCIIKLDNETVSRICNILSLKETKDTGLNNLSEVMSMLCLDKSNLEKFINELNHTIFRLSNVISSNINGYLSVFAKSEMVENLDITKTEYLEFILMKKEDIWKNDEVRFYKMFKILQRLFEKSIEIDIEKVDATKESQKDLLNNQNNPDEQTELPDNKPVQNDTTTRMITSDNTKSEVRSRFMALMEKKDLNKLWLDISELMNIVWNNLENSKRVLYAMTLK